MNNETVKNKNAKFCFGVKRAVDKVLKEIDKGNRTIYTLGPIIHNPQMVAMLKERGVVPVDDVKNIHEGTVVFRTHGVKMEEEEYIRKKGLESIDVTCPFVKRVRKRAMYLKKNGYQVVIIGDKNHAEVKSVLSYLDNDGIVLQESCRIDARKIGAVSQTTLDRETFTSVVTGLLDGAEEIRVYDTILQKYPDQAAGGCRACWVGRCDAYYRWKEQFKHHKTLQNCEKVSQKRIT